MIFLFLKFKNKYKKNEIGTKTSAGLIYKAQELKKQKKNKLKNSTSLEFSLHLLILLKKYTDKIKKNHPKFSVVPPYAEDRKNGRSKIVEEVNKISILSTFEKFFFKSMANKMNTINEKKVTDNKKYILLEENGFK